MYRLISISCLVFLSSCQFLPLLTLPESISIEEKIIEDIASYENQKN